MNSWEGSEMGFEKNRVECDMDFFVQGKLGIGFFERCKETFYSIKYREFLGLLRDSMKIV